MIVHKQLQQTNLRALCAFLVFALLSLILPESLSGQTRPAQRRSAKPVVSSAPAGAQPKYKGIWEPVSYPEDLKLFDVFFTTADEGWVAGGADELSGGVILHTTDGGDHWEIQLGDPQSSDAAFTE